MIIVKNHMDIEKLSIACDISAAALKAAGAAVTIGITAKELELIAVKVIKQAGAVPSFYKYGGFPGKICVSVNDTVIHGIPTNEKLKSGDIVSIDIGAYYNGYHGDNAATFTVGEVTDEAQKLVDVTYQSLHKAILAAKPGNRIGDISHAIQTHVEAFGFSPVKDWVGHGIGKDLHEDPQIPCFGEPGRGIRLIPGMTLAIEPMINIGTRLTKVLSDEWTVKTIDNSLSAHFEHTVAITNDGAKILTSGWEVGR